MLGFVIGLTIGTLFGSWSLASYKNVLVMKAEDGSREYIKDKFYEIREEVK